MLAKLYLNLYNYIYDALLRIWKKIFDEIFLYERELLLIRWKIIVYRVIKLYVKSLIYINGVFVYCTQQCVYKLFIVYKYVSIRKTRYNMNFLRISVLKSWMNINIRVIDYPDSTFFSRFLKYLLSIFLIFLVHFCPS